MAATPSNTVATELQFRDPRPPHELQGLFERYVMAVFWPGNEGGRLVYRSTPHVNGTAYTFELLFQAATRSTHCYRLRIAASCAHPKPDMEEYIRKSSIGWFDHWTRDLKAGPPPVPGEESPDRYRERVDEALAADGRHVTVAAIQQSILDGMRRGCRFTTSHKEGGTQISYRDGRYLRSDYGESSESQTYRDDASFLEFLRRFFQWEVSRGQPLGAEVPENTAWRLILRLMREP